MDDLKPLDLKPTFFECFSVARAILQENDIKVFDGLNAELFRSLQERQEDLEHYHDTEVKIWSVGIENLGTQESPINAIHYTMCYECPDEGYLECTEVAGFCNITQPQTKPRYHRDIKWVGEGMDMSLTTDKRMMELQQIISEVVDGEKNYKEIIEALNERGDLDDNDWITAMVAVGMLMLTR